MLTPESQLIAVIEDDNDLRSIYVQLLESHRFRVIAYHDGMQALEGLLMLTKRPSLILLDYMLPHLNGGELLTRLETSFTSTKIPVILVSALSEETPQILTAMKERPWVIGYSSKIDVVEGGLISLVNTFFGIGSPPAV